MGSLVGSPPLIYAVVRRAEGLVSGNWELTTRRRGPKCRYGVSQIPLWRAVRGRRRHPGAMVCGLCGAFPTVVRPVRRVQPEGSRSEVDV
jgi:hypothetical protein